MSISTSEIRSRFLNFFKKQGHKEVSSSSLVPDNDPTLLFTNAGMNQFKNVFLGLEARDYTSAVSSQRCVRAGGKHNDLENVGYTARHHTFFEMLGNFSFGAYFKREAIQYAWQFLTQELKIPAEKLFVTVFEDDAEAEAIWLKEIGIPQDSCARIGAKDNFWQMGDTGPCGPCSEIFYDHGPSVWGGPPGTPEEDGDRFIEIWNLVFMQFNRQSDGTLEPLPMKAVDTGMGLERLSAVLQDVHSNYETDTFTHLIKACAKLIGTQDVSDKSLRVIADHIRACAFLIADGVMPANEGRGYVLRRIIRRAVRHGRKLGCQETFFYKMLTPLIEKMGDAYPELKSQQTLIERSLEAEEQQFTQTLDRGLNLLEDAIKTLDGSTVLSGDVVFKLYDTYGFPADLTADVLRDRNVSIDHDGFERCMQQQRTRAKQASEFAVDYNKNIKTDCETTFIGYADTKAQATIVALFVEGKSVETCETGQDALVILDNTPFYAESGGQVGDQGLLTTGSATFSVHDTQKNNQAIVHQGRLTHGTLTCGDTVTASVDATHRQNAALNHSATHLLHAALRRILGEHVQQKGSLVTPERLRFDFVHPQSLSVEQIVHIEQQVNAQIRNNFAVTTKVMSLDAAKAAGALALFNEKYDSDVRVVQMGDYSHELCGGTHAARTGDLGVFQIVSETGVAAGIRRIEAISGETAFQALQNMQATLNGLAQQLKVEPSALVKRVTQLQQKERDTQREIEQLKAQMSTQKSGNLVEQAIAIKGHKVLVAKLEQADAKSLRTTLDTLKNKLQSAIIVLACSQGEKVSLIAGVTPDLTQKIKAGELVNMVAQQVGGKGGGRPDMAQAGGSEPAKLNEALNSVATWLEQRL